jgi:N-acetylmuramoyl-L-alanine amidase
MKKRKFTSTKFSSAIVGSVQVVSTVAVIAAAAMSVPGVQPAVQKKISQVFKTSPAKLDKIEMPPCSNANLCAKDFDPIFIALLDAGHALTGGDPGAERDGVQEAKLTQQITDKVMIELSKRGIHPFPLNPAGAHKELNFRTVLARIMNMVKNYSVDGKKSFVAVVPMISIHINSLPKKQDNNNISGVESFFWDEESKVLAGYLQKSLVETLKAEDHGIHKGDLHVIRNSPPPAVLLEVGFITNKKERELLQTPEYQQKIAEAIADGLVKYFAAKYKKGGNTKPQPPVEKQPVEGDEVDRAQVTMPEPAEPPVAQPLAPPAVPTPKQN